MLRESLAAFVAKTFKSHRSVTKGDLSSLVQRMESSVSALSASDAHYLRQLSKWMESEATTGLQVITESPDVVMQDFPAGQ